MADLTFTQELIKAAVGGAVPTIALVAGGRWLLDKYDLRKRQREHSLDIAARERSQDLELRQKQREQALELGRFIRQRQYEALQELYALFAQYMSLYRLINSKHVDLKEREIRLNLLKDIACVEGRVDAAILRVASEFTHDNSDKLASYLADLRQSVQIWREKVRDGEELPFYSSGQADYVRFKGAFVRTCTYLASQIYLRVEPTAVVVDQAASVLADVFDNRHEWYGLDHTADELDGRE